MDNTTHKYFDSNVAKELGTDCAIVLHNIQHWINYHKSNKTNYHDGVYWMYNSKRAFQEQFDWLSDSQIKTCLAKLEKYGCIVTGNHNKAGFDRTKWYSIPLKSTIGENCPMERSELTNALAENDQTIPDNKTNNKTIDFIKLLNYFNKVFNKNARLVNIEVRTALDKRIREGYTKEDIVKVIDNCSNDKHHVDLDYQYVSLKFLSKPDIFERYASQPHKKPLKLIEEAKNKGEIFTNQ